MKKDNFADFRYRLVESTIVNHKAVEVTYRYNGKVIKRYVFIKEAPGVDYIKYAQDVINNELNGNKLTTSSKELAKPSTSHKALKIALATSLTLGAITFGGLYAWRHFQNIADQHSIVVTGVADKINALNENSTDKDIEAAMKAYEKLTDEEKAALPQETKDYLQQQITLNGNDHHAADEIFERIHNWSPVSDVLFLNTVNTIIVNDDPVFPTKSELFETINEYDNASQRVKKYFAEDDTDGKEEIKRQQYNEVASDVTEFEALVDHLDKNMDSCTSEEIDRVDETIKNVKGKFIDRQGYVDIPAAERIIETARSYIEGDKEKAQQLFKSGVEMTTEGEGLVYITSEVISKAASDYASSSIRCRNAVDAMVKETYYQEKFKTYMDLIRYAYELLTRDRNEAVNLFNEYNEIEEYALDPENPYDPDASLGALAKLEEKAGQITGKYPRTGSFLNDYKFQDAINKLRRSIERAKSDVSYILERVDECFPHKTTQVLEPFIRRLESNYRTTNAIAKKGVDQGIKDQYQFSNFDEAIKQIWDDFNADKAFVNEITDELNSLVNDIATLPITTDDKAYKSIINRYDSEAKKISRISRLADDSGFNSLKTQLEESIGVADNMIALLVKYTDEKTVVSGETYVTDADINDLNNEYNQGSVILKNIVDKKLRSSLIFDSWADGINRAMALYDRDVAKAKPFTEQISKWFVEPPIEKTAVEQLKKDFDEMGMEFPRAALIAESDPAYPFSKSVDQLEEAIGKAIDMFKELCGFVDFAQTTCTDVEILKLDNTYQSGSPLLKKAVNSQIIAHQDTFKYKTWNDAITAALEAWRNDNQIGKELDASIHAVMSNPNEDAALTSAYHIVNDETFKNRNVRQQSYIKDYSSFKSKYLDTEICNQYEIVADASAIFTTLPTNDDDHRYDPLAGNVVDRGVYLEPGTYAEIGQIEAPSLSADYDFVLFSMKLNWSSSSENGPKIRVQKTNGQGEVVDIIPETTVFVTKDQYVSFKIDQESWDTAEGWTVRFSLKAVGTESVNFSVTDFYAHKKAS